MKLFGRKKNEEIEGIKNELNDVTQSLNEVKKECEEQVNELTTQIKNDNNEYDKKFEILEEKYEVLNDKLDKVQRIIKLMKELDEDTCVKKNKETMVKAIEGIPTKNNHLYVFRKGEYPLYKNVSLKGNKIVGARGEFKFTIEDVIGIKENLQEYHDKGYNPISIGRIYDIKRGTIPRLIYNIEEGVFDEIIDQYENKTVVESTDSHKISIGESYKKSYNQSIDEEGNLYLSTGKRMPYHIEDIIRLKEVIYDDNTHTVQDVLKHFNYNYGTGCRLIWNIEEGTYDGLIEDYKNGVFNHGVKQDEKQAHFRDVPKSLHKKITGDLVIVDGGELFNKKWGRDLGYTIQDIIELQERIPDFNNYPTFEDLGDGLNMSLATIKTNVWRIEEGYFNDLIEEYLSRNYTYENNFNRLFVDGKNTGLSIDKSMSIIECIINTPNKKETVNKLIKMYPTVDSKYIRILSEEYNNPNLSKVLRKKVKKVEKIDNPQKRREQGVYL